MNAKKREMNEEKIPFKLKKKIQQYLIDYNFHFKSNQ